MSLQQMLPSIKLLIIKHNEENRLKVDACVFLDSNQGNPHYCYVPQHPTHL